MLFGQVIKLKRHITLDFAETDAHVCGATKKLTVLPLLTYICEMYLYNNHCYCSVTYFKQYSYGILKLERQIAMENYHMVQYRILFHLRRLHWLG